MSIFRKKLPVNVVVIQPSEYIHSISLLEVAEYFCALAKKCGHSTELTKNRFDSYALNIVLCSHLLQDGSMFPKGSVIFNSEQLGEQKGVFDYPHYRDLLRRYAVWDYAPTNLLHIDSEFQALVPFYYCRDLDRIVAREKTIDLLFYGSPTDRRLAQLAEMQRCGVNAVAAAGIYGPERDALIAQSRAVLNLHQLENRTLEQVRCFYPLSNGIPVFSEPYDPDSAPPDYAKVLFVPEDNEPLAPFVADMLSNRGAFAIAAHARLEHFRTLDPLPEFSEALEMALENHGRLWKGRKPAVPTRMNLGSGQDYRPGYLNIDIDPSVEPDVVIDLSQTVELPKTVPSRTGEVVFQRDMFDEILAIEVLQHVGHLPELMSHCLDLLKVGGKLQIRVPYDLSLGAWQDPRHVRAFNENSWLYFTDSFWDLGWFSYRFVREEMRFLFSAFGEKLKFSGLSELEVTRTPRAVDAMLVTLVKKETTVEERQLARSRRSDFQLPTSVARRPCH